MKKITSSRNILFYISIFAVFLMSMYAGLADFDYYWQMTLGKNIVESGDLNSIYNLVWGTEGVTEYLDHEWLTNVFFYVVTLFGGRSIAITKLIICSFIGICTICYIKNEDKELNTFSVIAILLYSFLISVIFVKVKAYSISLGFILLELVLLKKYRKSKLTKIDNYSIYNWKETKDYKELVYFFLMLVLCIVWNNMHSGSIPLFFGIAGIYWLIYLRKDFYVPAYGLVCFIGCLGLNPYGPKLFIFNLLHNGDKFMKQYVGDWKSLDAKEPIGLVCALVLLLTLLSINWVDYKKHLFDLIMILIISFMGLQSIRHLFYLLPFFISVVLDNKFNIKKLSIDIMQYICFFCLGLSLLCNYGVFTSSDYDKSYAIDYVDDEFEDILNETLKDGCDGLFTSEIDLWTRGYQTFTTGAYPCVKQRYLDSYMLQNCASEIQIKDIIDHYKLNKFIIFKDNTLIDYYKVNSVLYDYLANNDKYELVYSSDVYYYFIER